MKITLEQTDDRQTTDRNNKQTLYVTWHSA